MAIRFQLTRARLQANRRNARKSTGPRSEEGKRRSAENGRRAAALPPQCSAPTLNLARPARNLTRELAAAFRPSDAAERLLVEELARLHDRKRVNQEAQSGLILKTWEKLLRQRAEHQLELTLEHSDHPAPLAVASGYIHMEDSPAKFRQISRMLSAVRDGVGAGNISPEGQRLLKTIYGPCPSMRGGGILANYGILLERSYQPRADAAEAPPAESTDGTAAAGPPPEESEEARAARLDRLHLEGVREALLRALEEEKSILGAKYVEFLREHVPPFEVLKQAALVPADQAWHSLLQQDQALDRQIESKTRLLLFVQWARRSRRKRRNTLYKGEPKPKRP